MAREQDRLVVAAEPLPDTERPVHTLIRPLDETARTMRDAYALLCGNRCGLTVTIENDQDGTLVARGSCENCNSPGLPGKAAESLAAYALACCEAPGKVDPRSFIDGPSAPNPDWLSVGQYLSLLRQQANMTLAQVGGFRTGDSPFTKSYLSEIERGVSPLTPAAATAYELALGLRPGSLAEKYPNVVHGNRRPGRPPTFRP